MAARGLDIPALTHVVNFDAPRSAREYVHRAGRAGRLSSTAPGRRGTVVSLPVGAAELARMAAMLADELGVAGVRVLRAAAGGGGGGGGDDGDGDGRDVEAPQAVVVSRAS